MKEMIVNGIITGSIICGIAFGILYSFLSTPDVVMSYSTKKCMYVEYADGSKGDCSKLPEKYNLIWGK